jgi:hypothetical protein
MTDPSFKSFEKASMMPANMIPSNQSYNIIYNINKEETNVTPLCVSRTPQNFGKHIYIIYSSDITNINRCLTYLQRLTKLNIESTQLDGFGEFNEDSYKKGSIYQFNLLKNDIKNANLPDTIGFIMEKIIEKSDGVILIADEYKDIPQILTTMSHLVFIDKNVKNVEGIVRESSGLSITNYNYDFSNMLCVNKTTLWAKLSSF